MFKIGEFSKLSKTTIKALRYYDEIGLLKPESIDRLSGYRLYTSSQLITLHNIQALKQAGLSINEIKQLLAGANSESVLLKRKAKLVSTVNEVNNQLSFLEFILQGKEEERLMSYQAIIKELPSATIYSKKMTLASYDEYFDVIPEIGEEIVSQYPDLKCTVPEYCFIVYLDGEYRDKDINIEFCEAVDKRRADFGDIVFKEIPACLAVAVLHKGPYDKIAQAYAFAFKWMEDNSYQMADNPRESYIDGIWNKEDENDWLTELQIPITKK